ncbi:hypothetical protein IAQ61_005621 [Plenodomus lingam]|uniref:Predicted protein n=1 Tax=Leptosphaeria maculans (strain JN3 / isolate v23.1.3 / race Av1-4-5-6-7-8) TaxID=985895 RepID=E4ZYI6_LEPMJ|nr:predicted protein [Plenodomus lingam JN3]KAH9871442.1 hypothetical protein IAQ61_005621 [Plenodomus lingam]CBX96512.1 predicted protein [Plenodomus lingam JN3]
MLLQLPLKLRGCHGSPLSAETPAFIPGDTPIKQSEGQHPKFESEHLEMDGINAAIYDPIDASGTGTASVSNETSNNQLPATENPGNVERCDFCDTTGRILDCCRTSRARRPCTTCTRLAELFTQDYRKQQECIEDLKHKLEQQNRETLDERYTRLHVEKNRRIEQLKEETMKVEQEDAELRADAEKRQWELKALNMEIRRLQPVQLFFIKERKGKK